MQPKSTLPRRKKNSTTAITMSLAKAEVVKLSVSRISWSDVLVPSLAREAGLVSFAMMFLAMTSL